MSCFMLAFSMLKAARVAPEMSCLCSAFSKLKAARVATEMLCLCLHLKHRRCKDTSQTCNFSSIFDVGRPFRAKGFSGKIQNCNFTSVFDLRRPFRAKGLLATP